MKAVTLEQIGQYTKHGIELPAKDVLNGVNNFQTASLEAFFEGDDDKNVDWLKVFDVKSQ